MIPRVASSASRRAVFLLAVVSLAVACSKFPSDKSAEPVPGQPVPHATIVFMSDFGVANDAVAICKAVILGIVPDAYRQDPDYLARGASEKRVIATMIIL